MKNRNKSSIIFITLIVVVLLLIGGSTTILASKRKVTAIGDSVMLGAVPNIKKTVPGCTVDAKVSRQVVKGTEIAKQLNKKGKLGNIVVIALGTNGPFKQSAGQKLINYLGKKEDDLLDDYIWEASKMDEECEQSDLCVSKKK